MKVTSISSDSVEISLRHSNGGGVNQTFCVLVRPDGGDGFSICHKQHNLPNAHEREANNMNQTVRGLKANTKYHLRVMAKNKIGSTNSAAVEFTTHGNSK